MPEFKNSKLLLLLQQSGLQLKIAMNTAVHKDNSFLCIYSFSGCSYFRKIKI